MSRAGLNANVSSILRTITDFTMYLVSMIRPILGRCSAVGILESNSTIKTISFYNKFQGMIYATLYFYGSIPATYLDLSSKTSSSKKRKFLSDDNTMKTMMKSQKLVRDSI